MRHPKWVDCFSTLGRSARSRTPVRTGWSAGAALVIGLLAVMLPGAVRAEISGSARVIDGDTLEVAGRRVRLFGIDAPELGQTCVIDGRERDCGLLAKRKLADEIGSAEVTCRQIGVSASDTVIARCFLRGEDLGRWLVGQGWALAYIRYSENYLTQESFARDARIGIWASKIQPPWEWRSGQRSAAGAASVEAITDDHDLFLADDVDLVGYTTKVNLGYLWANILLAFIAFGGFWLTSRQIRISARQARAAVLIDMDKRWESEHLQGSRKELNRLLINLQREFEGSPQGAPDFSAFCAARLGYMRANDYEKFFTIAELCGFFETVGYVTEKGYLDFDDVYELYGPAISSVGTLFAGYWREQQRTNPHLHDHLLSLYERTRQRDG